MDPLDEALVAAARKVFDLTPANPFAGTMDFIEASSELETLLNLSENFGKAVRCEDTVYCTNDSGALMTSKLVG